jgi:hypothetical protein
LANADDVKTGWSTERHMAAMRTTYTAPELSLGRDDEMLVERIGVGFDLDPPLDGRYARWACRGKRRGLRSFWPKTALLKSSHRRTDDSKVEPFATPDIAVENLTSM